jgi:hypothetical protein
MPKVYVKLAGGLGNQLFQIANGYAYAKRHRHELLLDDSDWTASQGKSPRDYQNSIFANFEYVSRIVKKTPPIEYTEQKFNYHEIPNFYFDVSLSGYFQSLKYFEDYKDDFISQLCLPKCPMFEDAVAVHVRRGDYLQHAHIHYVCDTEYFKENMKKFPDKKIHVFTDSKDFVQKEFWDHDFQIIETGSELGDLTAMANHSSMICSNSSFSWWASLLGIKKEKVIVPKKWFNNYQKHDDIYRTDFTISNI